MTRATRLETELAESSRETNAQVRDLEEARKELEIKLDITKKGRKINRPVQFHDQTGEQRLVDKLSS